MCSIEYMHSLSLVNYRILKNMSSAPWRPYTFFSKATIMRPGQDTISAIGLRPLMSCSNMPNTAVMYSCNLRPRFVSSTVFSDFFNLSLAVLLSLSLTHTHTHTHTQHTHTHTHIIHPSPSPSISGMPQSLN